MSGDPMVYETQFFGFTPQTFMLRIYTAFQNHLSHLMVIVEEVILNKLKEDGRHWNLTPSDVQRGTKQFYAFIKERFETLYGQLESSVLSRVLSIPPNVLLPEDQGQENVAYTEEQQRELEAEIKELERQLEAETQAELALQAELEEQRVVQAHLEKILRWMDGLGQADQKEGTGSLWENFAAMTNEAARLRDTFQELDDAVKGVSASEQHK